MTLRYGLISADSHVLEPGELWTSALGERFGDALPRIVKSFATSSLDRIRVMISITQVRTRVGRGQDDRPRPLRISDFTASKSALNSGFCIISVTMTAAPIWPPSQSDG